MAMATIVLVRLGPIMATTRMQSSRLGTARITSMTRMIDGST